MTQIIVSFQSICTFEWMKEWKTLFKCHKYLALKKTNRDTIYTIKYTLATFIIDTLSLGTFSIYR